MQAISSPATITVNRFLLTRFIDSGIHFGDTLEGSMKHLLRALVIIAGVLLLVVVGLSFLFNVNDFRPMLETELSGKLGRQVKLGGLKLALLSGGVSADDLSVADNPAFGNTPFLQAKSLAISVDLSRLIFSRKLNVTGLTIAQPEIVLMQAPSGEWNYSSLGAKDAKKDVAPGSSSTPSLDLSVKLVKITDGRLTMGRTKSAVKPQVFDKVNVEVRDFAADSAFPFSVTADVPGGGQLKIDGKAGPIDSSDAAMTPVEANLSLQHVDLVAAGFVEPASGFAGVISLDGTSSSDGRTLQSKGRVTADRLKLAKNGTPAAKAVTFDFANAYSLQKHTGVLNKGSVHIGKAEAEITGTYDLQGQFAVVNMKVSGPNMPLQDLEAMLPAFGIVLPSGSSLQGGTAHVAMVCQGPTDRLVTAGTLGLANTKLVGFDLGSKIKTIAALAGIKTAADTDIQTFSANVRSDPSGITVENLSFIAPTIGELSGAGTVSESRALDFKMLVKLHNSGGLLSAVSQNGEISVPFFIKGTASNPAFAPDVKGMAKTQVDSLKSDGIKKAKGLLDGFLNKK